MIDLAELTSGLTYSIKHSGEGVRFSFYDNSNLLKCFTLLNSHSSFYRDYLGGFDIYTDVKFSSSNSNTRTIFYKCQIKHISKEKFLPYLRKEKIKEIWSDID